MAITHKHRSSHYGKPDGASAMFLLTFFAVLVAVALFALILVRMFNTTSISPDMASAMPPYTAPNPGGNPATMPTEESTRIPTANNNTSMTNTQ